MTDEDRRSLGGLAESDIPPGWTAAPLTDLATIASGQVDPREAPYRWWPLIAPNHIESDTGHLLGEIETAEEQGAISGKYEVRPGDVVYSKIRPYLRKAWLADREALCSADMYPLRVNGSVDARYLLGIVLSGDFSRYAERMSARTGIPKINRDGLSGYHVPLPPIPEQRKIAAILSSVDDAIAATRKVIEQTKRVKQGLLHTLMTRGIGHRRFKKTEIGEIPETWEVVILGKLGRSGTQTVRSGPFGSSLKGEHFADSGTPVLTIQSLGEGKIESDGLFFVSSEKARELKAYEVRAGDLVFSRVADIGRSVVIEKGADGWIISSNLIRISLDQSKTNPSYMMYCIVGGGAVTRQIKRLAGDQGRPVVSSTMLKDLRFPLAPKAEQDEIVSRIGALNDASRCHQQGLARLEQLKRGLMQDLLTGRVRVQPD